MGGGLRGGRGKTLNAEDLEAYAALGLEPKPFQNFRIFAPFKPGQAPGGKGDLDVQLDRLAGTFPGKLNTNRDNPLNATGSSSRCSGSSSRCSGCRTRSSILPISTTS